MVLKYMPQFRIRSNLKKCLFSFERKFNPIGLMKIINTVILIILLEAILQLQCKGSLPADDSTSLMGNRFLTFNAVIRVNQIEVTRDKHIGEDERSLHTPARVIQYREAIEAGFPGARITWAFSWLALNDTSADYRKIRDLVVSYHKKYGDDYNIPSGGILWQRI